MCGCAGGLGLAGVEAGEMLSALFGSKEAFAISGGERKRASDNM